MKDPWTPRVARIGSEISSPTAPHRQKYRLAVTQKVGEGERLVVDVICNEMPWPHKAALKALLARVLIPIPDDHDGVGPREFVFAGQVTITAHQHVRPSIAVEVFDRHEVIIREG